MGKGRPRKSIEEVKLNGSYQHNKGRYKAREDTEPTDLEVLGRAPNHLTPFEQKVWREVVSGCPTGWLKRTDRIAVEVAVQLTCGMREGTITERGMAMLTATLSKLGFTPTDRRKISISKKAVVKNDPWSEFSNPSGLKDEKTQ